MKNEVIFTNNQIDKRNYKTVYKQVSKMFIKLLDNFENGIDVSYPIDLGYGNSCLLIDFKHINQKYIILAKENSLIVKSYKCKESIEKKFKITIPSILTGRTILVSELENCIITFGKTRYSNINKLLKKLLLIK